MQANRHRFPVHQFWCAGPVWTHLDARGRYQGFHDWQQLSLHEFAQAIRRYHASAAPGKGVLWRWPEEAAPSLCGVDDGALEVFLGARVIARAR
jgi:hypothetical protein